MCTILLTVSIGFMGRMGRPSIQNECFIIHAIL